MNIPQDAPYYLHAMEQKHRLQIRMHEASYGAPLGQLRRILTQKELDDSYEAFCLEKYGFIPEGTIRRMPKKKAAPKNVTRPRPTIPPQSSGE